MKKFQKATVAKDPEQRERIIEDTLERFPLFTRTEIEWIVDSVEHDEIWLNDLYQVNIRRIEIGGRKVAWLSIKRIDKESCHDWRHFQEIKNHLVGPECEGVELYPAESRTVDTANQYHLYVVEDPTFRFPFGFQERMIDYTESRDSKQRKKEEMP